MSRARPVRCPPPLLFTPRRARVSAGSVTWREGLDKTGRGEAEVAKRRWRGRSTTRNWLRSGARVGCHRVRRRLSPRHASAKARTAHTRLRAPASDAIAPNWGRARAFECYLFPLEYNRAIGPRPDCNRSARRRPLVCDCVARFRMRACQGLFALERLSSDGSGGPLGIRRFRDSRETQMQIMRKDYERNILAMEVYIQYRRWLVTEIGRRASVCTDSIGSCRSGRVTDTNETAVRARGSSTQASDRKQQASQRVRRERERKWRASEE
ncbi:hypothetical protein C8Q76DRAFT_468987 [Earliella scabrosa]|nr:hypothetical protein C8Q76DRAFT_468987 [Earliella scabrosa]